MKKVVIFSAILSVLFTSCIFSPSIKGDGNIVEEIRKTDKFDELKISRGMNVYISQGNKTKVLVKADGNLHDVIVTEVTGDVLEIKATSNIRKAKVKKVFVTTPDVVAIKAFAGSNVFSETNIETDKIEIAASAGSNIKLNIKAYDTHVSASAGSNISLEGTTISFYGKASSGSNIKARDLSSENTTAKTSSGANIWITSVEELNGTASSGGNVFYYGSPKNTNISRSSGGNVIKKTN